LASNTACHNLPSRLRFHYPIGWKRASRFIETEYCFGSWGPDRWLQLERVIERLQEDGYNVTTPQFPLTSTDADVARLRHVLTLQDGPTIVAGHSYDGQIMIALGMDAPNVVGLVYIAAFGLDEGESIGTMLSHVPPAPPLSNLQIDALGFAWLPQADFVNHFASNVDPEEANVMYAVQQPVHIGTLCYGMGVPAWSALPTW
jgi:pimeloyl-ACP methyl ester carboxylesterase